MPKIISACDGAPFALNDTTCDKGNVQTRKENMKHREKKETT
jgi:hypothetical protein